MPEGLGEAWTALEVSFEELVGEVLCEECEKKIAALWIRNEAPAQQETFSELLRIREFFLSFREGSHDERLRS